MTALEQRVVRASEAPPLSALAASDRRELDVVLAGAERFEDLPGKWQAALLAAELGGQQDGGSPSCCGHH